MGADEIIKQKRSGGTITHTIASTNRKHVGTFVGQGVQVGQETPFSLPLMVIQRETTQDILWRKAMEEVMEAVKNITKKNSKSSGRHATEPTESIGFYLVQILTLMLTASY